MGLHLQDTKLRTEAEKYAANFRPKRYKWADHPQPECGSRMCLGMHCSDSQQDGEEKVRRNKKFRLDFELDMHVEETMPVRSVH